MMLVVVTRARELTDHKSISGFPITAEQVERLTDDVHGIISERARWPHRMIRAVTARLVEALLRVGVNPQIIRDAVRDAAPRARAPIKTFGYFMGPSGPIMRAHAECLRARSRNNQSRIHVR